MSRLKRAWSAWDRWWLGEVPPHALALIRIAAGGWLFGYWLIKLPAVPMLFSDRGITIPLFTKDAPALVLLLLRTPAEPTAWLLYGLLLSALLCLCIGLRSQLAAAVAFGTSLYFWLISLHMYGTSFDMLYMFILFSLVWSDAGGTYSLDMRLRHGSWTAWKPVCAMSQRLIAVQLTATYVGVCWQKFELEEWRDGRVLYYSMIGFWASPAAFWFVRHVPWRPFYDVLLQVVELIQFVIPIGLWVRGIRPVGVAAGVTFHLLITLFLGMGWFLAMLPCYLAFPHPAAVRDWVFRRFPALAGAEVR